MAQTGFPLPLRNALAKLAIAALDDATAASAIAWLASDLHTPPSAVTLERLATVHLIDHATPRLLDVHTPWTAATQAHAARAVAASIQYRPLSGPRPRAADVAVAKAAALWGEGLFFEVHEVLEAEWLHTTGDLRTALQGLIQVAVAFHHLAHGNQRGARSLFHDGRERLSAAGEALPLLDTPALLAATAEWEAAVALGAWPGSPPPMPLRTAAD